MSNKLHNPSVDAICNKLKSIEGQQISIGFSKSY